MSRGFLHELSELSAVSRKTLCRECCLPPKRIICFNDWQIFCTIYTERHFSLIYTGNLTGSWYVIMSEYTWTTSIYICLFNDSVHIFDYSAEWKDHLWIDWCWRKWSWPNLRHPGTCLVRLKKPTKTLNQDSRSPGRGLKSLSLDYKAGMIIDIPRLPVGMNNDNSL
jgi:hypothetical protein